MMNGSPQQVLHFKTVPFATTTINVFNSTELPLKLTDWTGLSHSHRIILNPEFDFISNNNYQDLRAFAYIQWLSSLSIGYLSEEEEEEFIYLPFRLCFVSLHSSRRYLKIILELDIWKGFS